MRLPGVPRTVGDLQHIISSRRARQETLTLPHCQGPRLWRPAGWGPDRIIVALVVRNRTRFHPRSASGPSMTLSYERCRIATPSLLGFVIYARILLALLTALSGTPHIRPDQVASIDTSPLTSRFPRFLSVLPIGCTSGVRQGRRCIIVVSEACATKRMYGSSS